MLSKRAIAAVVGCAVVGTALGANSKIKDLVPVGLGLTENPGGDGHVKLKYKDDQFETKIHVHIQDFVPNTTYGIKVVYTEDEIVADNFPLALTTNCGGSGTYVVTVPGDTTADPKIYIYLWDADILAIDEVTATEIRAIGVGSCD